MLLKVISFAKAATLAVRLGKAVWYCLLDFESWVSIALIWLSFATLFTQSDKPSYLLESCVSNCFNFLSIEELNPSDLSSYLWNDILLLYFYIKQSTESWFIKCDNYFSYFYQLVLHAQKLELIVHVNNSR